MIAPVTNNRRRNFWCWLLAAQTKIFIASVKYLSSFTEPYPMLSVYISVLNFVFFFLFSSLYSCLSSRSRSISAQNRYQCLCQMRHKWGKSSEAATTTNGQKKTDEQTEQWIQRTCGQTRRAGDAIDHLVSRKQARSLHTFAQLYNLFYPFKFFLII